MDHEYIDRYDLVDRYLMGKLAATESEEFEEHFVTCQSCTERLKTTQHFLHDLRHFAVQRATPAQSARQDAVAMQPQSRFFRQPLALAATLLLLAATVSAVFLLARVQRLRAEVAVATGALAQAERRYEEQRQSASQSESARRQAEQELAEKVRELEARIQNGGNQSRSPRGASQPAINVPIFVLSADRGSGANPSTPVNEVKLPRSTASYIVSIAMEGDERYDDYRIRIAAEGERQVWQKSGLRPDRYNALSLSFPADFFPPGSYLLTLEGVTKEGGSKPISNYPFRVRKEP